MKNLTIFCILIIPFVTNKILFKRVKAPKTDDRKWHCIDLILCHLRSSICRQLSRSLNRILFVTIGITSYFPLNSFEISAKGYWIGDVEECHAIDGYLGEAIADFFVEQQTRSVVDFGCGLGSYVKQLRERGLIAKGYDGNPETPILSGGIGEVLDLSEPVQLSETFDWVMSLEVGEHLPQEYETIFIENLMRHANVGIVLSWAIKNQGGTGHFNEQNNDYIKAIFASYGYTNDLEAERKLRSSSKTWFQNSLMVFRKPNNGP